MQDPFMENAFKMLESGFAKSITSGGIEKEEVELTRQLSLPGKISRGQCATLRMIGYFYAVRAGAYLGRGDHEEVRTSLANAVAFKALAFLLQAAVPHPKQPGILPLPFESGLDAAGPCVAGWWPWATQCARWLAHVAETNQRLKPPEVRSTGWGKGTSDAFLIALFADALDVSTTYAPVRPLHTAYADLISQWRTRNEDTFRQAMQAAAVYHESQSRISTEKTPFDFDDPPDWIFPMELLAVQSLRRRDGLPEFQAGNAMVDNAWVAAQGLRLSNCTPLALQAAARLQSDYPQLQDLLP
ncbi:hypothetical protein NRY95_05565 [Xanthomonas campestris pv. phormiicola]|nr:hypothetical protein [Xanthomonas campestris pv. phormiicola]UYC17432.1 hypothetical protein NRY95_05565 [Xanthomonas campestris pv. phormiicola]